MIGESLHVQTANHRFRTRVVLLTVSLLFGLVAARVEIGYLPPQVHQRVAVIVRFDNAFPDEIERAVTIPIEEAVSGTRGVELITSQISFESSRTIIEISAQENLDDVMMDVSSEVQRVARDFPERAHRPLVVKNDPNDAPVFIVALPLDSGFTEQELRTRFESVDGTGQVEIAGAPRPEVLVSTPPALLAGSVVSSGPLFRALADTGNPLYVDPPSGTPIVLDGRVGSLGEIEALPVPPTTIPIGRISTVSLTRRQPGSQSRINGSPAITVFVRAAGDSNPVRLSRQLRVAASGLPSAVVTYDYGELVESAVREIAVAIALGMLLVAIATMFLVGRSAGPALAISIPFSALVAVGTLSLLSMTLDVTALAGIVMGIGVAIDAAIVYADAYSGADRDVKQAWSASAPALYLSTTTTLVVFVPLIFGSPRIVIPQQGLAIAFGSTVLATLGFIVCALPALLPTASIPTTETSGEHAPDRARNRRWYRPKIFACAIVVLLVFAGAASWHLQSLAVANVVVEGDTRVNIVTDFPAGTAGDAVEQMTSSLERELIDYPSVRNVTSRYEQQRAEFTVTVDRVDSEAAVRNLAVRYRSAVPDATIVVTGGSDSDRWIPVVVGADSHIAARDLAQRIAVTLNRRTDSEVVFHFKESPRSYRAVLRSSIVSLAAASPADVVSQVFSYLSEPVVFKLQVDGEERDVRNVRDDVSDPSLSDLASRLVSFEGTQLPLREIADLRESSRPATFVRRNYRPSASFSVVVPADLEPEALRLIEERIAEADVASGQSVQIDSAYFESRAANQELTIGIALATLLVVLVLIAYFQNWFETMSAFAVLAVSMTLPIIVMAIISDQVSSSILVGLVITAGLAVNHAVLVLNLSRRETGSEFQTTAVLLALSKKRRAMIAATATTVLGLVPVLIQSTGSGSFLAPLSLTIALGSIGSIGATFLVLPLATSIRHFVAVRRVGPS